MIQKLGRATNLRMALLKGQVTDLLWKGRIETTLDRAKSVSRMADKILTLAINTHEDKIEIKKTVLEKDKKNPKLVKEVEVSAVKDGAKKLAARRAIMAKVYDMQELPMHNESATSYNARTKTIAHPLVEKIFNELAPKYETRAKEVGTKGGYTRVLKMGPRRGDAAEMAIVELV